MWSSGLGNGRRPYALPGGTMANKDKGGRSTKKAAAKDLKQKRLDKKNKRDEADRKSKGKLV